MKRTACYALLSVIFLFTFSCGEDQGGGGESKGNISVTLLSPALSRNRATLSNCSPNFGSGPVNGKCFTPTKFSAKASQVGMGANYSGLNTVPVRLIGLSASPEGSGLEGPFGVLGLASFDFATETVVTNEYSEDNIEDQSNAGAIYDFISVTVGAAEMQIEIPAANAGVTNKFWTIRYPFMAKNPLDLSAFSSCPSETHTRELITSDGNLYSAPSGFLAGDILVCQKSTASATCADSDFNFINSTNGALSTTRPASPVTLSNSFWLEEGSCEESGEHPEMEFGHATFVAEVTSPFKLVKTREDGTATYTLTGDCNTSTQVCTGTPTSAEEVTLAIRFDLADGVFVHSDVDLESDTEAAILMDLEKVVPKNFYRASLAAADSDLTQDVQITATISLSETVR